MPDHDRRIDDLLILGDRCTRLSTFLSSIEPITPDDLQVLDRLVWSTRMKFWNLAHSIMSSGLPR